MTKSKGTLGHYWYEGEMVQKGDQVIINGTVTCDSRVFRGSISLKHFKGPKTDGYELHQVEKSGSQQAYFSDGTRDGKTEVLADSMKVGSFWVGSGIEATGNVSVSGLWSAKGKRVKLEYDDRSILEVHEVTEGSLTIDDHELSADQIVSHGYYFKTTGKIKLHSGEIHSENILFEFMNYVTSIKLTAIWVDEKRVFPL